MKERNISALIRALVAYTRLYIVEPPEEDHPMSLQDFEFALKRWDVLRFFPLAGKMVEREFK